MSVRPPLARRLLIAALYAGCVGAAGLAARPFILAESSAPPIRPIASPTADPGPFLLPPGTWNVFSAGQLHDLPTPPPACPLIPPGVEPLAVRTDAAGRVSAFVTGPEEWAAFARHWADGGWTVADARDSAQADRTLAVTRGAEQAVAWVFPPAGQPGRVRLLVTVRTPNPEPEDRP